MRNRVYWGLGVLIILLIATTTVVVIRSNKETQRLRDELAQLEAQKKVENTPHAVDISETKPPDEPGFKWVRHGDHWDKVPIRTPDESQDEPKENQDARIGYICQFCNRNHDELTLEEAKQCRRSYESGYLSKYGVPAPPVGSKWRHFLDKDGNVHVLYPGEVTVIRVDTKIGFAPTKTQFDKYQQLKQDHKTAVQEKRLRDAEKIADEIRQLKAQAQGKIPIGAFVLLDADTSMSKERQKELQIQAAYKAQRDAYIEMGLAHIMPNHLRNIR